MSVVDWNARATLQQREDSGSDMFYGFETVGEGPLGAMVRQAMAMPPNDRARIVLDVTGMGMLNVEQLVELSQRDDYPGA